MTSITLRNQYTETIWYSVVRNSSANINLDSKTFSSNSAISLPSGQTSNSIALGATGNTAIYVWIGSTVSEGSSANSVLVLNRVGQVMTSITDDKVVFVSIGQNQWAVEESRLVRVSGHTPWWVYALAIGGLALVIIVIVAVAVRNGRNQYVDYMYD